MVDLSTLVAASKNRRKTVKNDQASQEQQKMATNVSIYDIEIPPKSRSFFSEFFLKFPRQNGHFRTHFNISFFCDFQMSHYDLYIFMKQFGTIMSMENDFNGEFFVVFLRTEATDTLKTQGTVRIDGRKTVTIQWTHDNFWKNYGHWNTSKSKRSRALMVVPDEHSPDNILNALNDDCIRNIIETCIFDAVGLYELAKVCTRFQYIAQQIFETKYRQHSWFYRTLTFWQPLSLIEDFYRIFGGSIIELDFGQRYNSDIVNGIVDKYCPKLESVKCELNEQQSCKEIRLLANRVKRLHIKWPRYETLDLTGIFDRCTNLEFLSIYNADAKLMLPRIKLPSLIHFRVMNAQFGNSVMIKGFFKQNSQLKRLNLHNVCLSFGMEHILRMLPDLETICFNYTWQDFRCDNYDCFEQLTKLKVLRTLIDTNETLAILNAIARYRIELDSLRFHLIADSVEIENAVCQMKSLQCLEIECVRGDNDLRRYVQELPELIELKVNIINTANAVEILRHAKDNLGIVTFTITYDDNDTDDMEKRLEDILATAKSRDFLLTVVLLYNLNENELPVSFTLFGKYLLFLSFFCRFVVILREIFVNFPNSNFSLFTTTSIKKMKFSPIFNDF